ncbi:MAG: ATP-binding protein [bacterium]
MKFVKKFIILFLVAAIASAVLIYFLWDNYRVRRDDLYLQTERQIQNQLDYLLDSQRLIAEIIYDQSLNNTAVSGYLNQAYQSDAFTKNDLRQGLAKDLTHVYKVLQDKNFDYLHFYLPDGESFVRLDDLNNFGENLTNDRYTVRLVNELQEYIEGFEIDNDFSGYRYVFPLFVDKKYVGAVELGISFNNLRHELDKRYPMTYNFLLTKEVLERKIDLEGNKNYLVSDLSQDHLYIRDNEKIRRVFTVPARTVALIDWYIKGEITNELAEGKPFIKMVDIDNLHYLATFIPVNSVTERQTGYLVTYALDSSIYTLQQSLQIQYIVVISLFFIILFFVKYVNDSQRELMDKNEELSNIAQTIGEGLIVIRKNKNIMFFNNAAERLTGYMAHEVLGRSYSGFMRFMDEASGQNVDEFIKNTIHYNKQHTVGKDTVLKVKDDNLVPIAAVASPLLNRNMETVGCIVVFRDVTKEREVDRAKTEFVSLASHQLQTPLSAVNWHTEMLLDGAPGPLNKKQKEFVRAIFEGNQRMIKLVNALLNVSRIDMGTLSVTPKKTNLTKLINTVIEELLFKIDVKDLKIVKKYVKLPKINIDAQLMSIVLQNVISNAIKYSREKSKVYISTSKDKHYVIIAVKDYGYGIPKAEQPRIFTKLFRADNVKTRKVEGTGLGLYVAKSVIDAFRGKIWFVSEENKGTTFFIAIPLKGAPKIEGTRGLEYHI